MERREFLIRSAKGGSLLLILPVGWTVAGCGSNSTTPTGTGSALRFTSSNVQGHTHDFSIDLVDLTSPPVAGLSGDTTVSLGHTHTVSLSQSELQEIEAGQTISKDTSSVQGHTHNFAFSASASAGSGGSGTTGAGGSTGTGGSTGQAGSPATGAAGLYHY
jgi:hypothetical protein